MRRTKILIIIILVVLIGILFSYNYLLNIYEVVYKVTPKELYADYKSTVKIECIPINAFGWKIPFRNTYCKFEITEGKDLIEILNQNGNKGEITLRAKNLTGKVEILVKSRFSLLPTSIDIEIYPNSA